MRAKVLRYSQESVKQIANDMRQLIDELYKEISAIKVAKEGRDGKRQAQCCLLQLRSMVNALNHARLLEVEDI